MPIPVLDGKPVIGRAEPGDIMKLMEMFSAIGAPKTELSDIDWVDDLKFYIDNDTAMLQKNLFPAVEKHKKYIDHPDAYKIYLDPLLDCCKSYCKKFEIEEPTKKFPRDKLIELAKKIAEEQKKFIEKGDYDQ